MASFGFSVAAAVFLVLFSSLVLGVNDSNLTNYSVNFSVPVVDDGFKLGDTKLLVQNDGVRYFVNLMDSSVKGLLGDSGWWLLLAVLILLLLVYFFRTVGVILLIIVLLYAIKLIVGGG